MRRYNRDPADGLELRFYGFDSPTEFGAADSPGHVLRYVPEYLGSVDAAAAEAYRERLEALLGAAAA
jgi:erythromycin esterase-like protein